MTTIRLAEFSGRPEQLHEAEWFTPEGRDGSIRVDRGDQAFQRLGQEAGHLVTTWTGYRIHTCGSSQRGEIAYLLKYPVPLDYLYEFDAWFQYEHMPLLLEEPAWYGCDFFRALGASSYSFVALHHLERSALKSDARNRSVDTPWWHRLAQHEWFDRGFLRTIMKPL